MINRRQLTSMVAAAISGIVAGMAWPAQGQQTETIRPGGGPTKAKQERHACKGQNSCKGKGGCGSLKGKNNCKGQGQCRTDAKPMSPSIAKSMK
jgi:hypothetical protein